MALVFDVYCDFVTFPFRILGPVWNLIVSIPDPCCLSYDCWKSHVAAHMDLDRSSLTRIHIVSFHDNSSLEPNCILVLPILDNIRHYIYAADVVSRRHFSGQKY